MLKRLKKLGLFVLLPLVLLFSLFSCGEAVDSLLGDGSLEDAILDYIDENVDDYNEPSGEETSAPSAPKPPVATVTEPVETHGVEVLPPIDEDGVYTSRDDVALYIHVYGKLPKNFITKEEAGDLGWEGGSLEPYAPGKCIGGNRFGNYEGLLPKKKGRTYTECDIDTLGQKSRGAKRIVFSNDGLIYYTDDHYDSFTLLYGEAE